MKKILSLMVLAMAIVSCQKDPIATQVTSDANKQKTATTVTTESALKSALSAAKAGDVITISGTIKPTATLKCTATGTSSSKITLQGGTLDFSSMSVSSSNRGVSLSGSYWVIKNMAIKTAGDNGIVVQTGGYNTISGVTITGCFDSGIQIYNSSHDNTVSSCTSNNNYDTQNSGENADGFACKLSAGKNNKFTGCSASGNSDDGWDLYGQPYTVTITSCKASTNGKGSNGDGNGFKLGSSGQSVAHTCTYCTSTSNKGCGYTGNGNTGHITTTGSTGSGNTKALWDRIY
jgi:parallel beta-helix repeat protein